MAARRGREARQVDEELISRGELVQSLFSVSDIALSLKNIELLLGGEDGEEETDAE